MNCSSYWPPCDSATSVHDLSARRGRLMVRVNCAAIPAALPESELFGREKGAYTGALSRQIGRFEMADRSTIFLDEIGDLPMEMQVKLMRVLQEKTFERLGSSRSLQADVRIIAATNRDHIRNVLERTGWRVRGERGAAAVLKLKPTTLEARTTKLGLRRPTK